MTEKSSSPIELQDLLTSSADIYLNHGLISTGISYFLPEIVQSWFNQPDNSIFRHQGMFTLPVCELQYYNWRQSDAAGTSSPPCDCRKFSPLVLVLLLVSLISVPHSIIPQSTICWPYNKSIIVPKPRVLPDHPVTNQRFSSCTVTAQDQCGGKFMYVDKEEVKEWINKSCH